MAKKAWSEILSVHELTIILLIKYTNAYVGVHIDFKIVSDQSICGKKY